MGATGISFSVVFSSLDYKTVKDVNKNKAEEKWFSNNHYHKNMQIGTLFLMTDSKISLDN